MGHSLTVKICDAGQDLLKAALNLAGGHAAALDSRIQVATWAKLHHFTPMLILVLNEIHSLDNIDMMQR